ncbi:MAG: YaeQ family protein [Labilithrix sp.]
MAAGATIHQFEIAVSDVDRSVYETLDLRVAQHPSETMPRLLVRTLAYCLAYEEGIAFSKGGLGAVEDAPIAVHDPTGLLLHWIEIGAPSAERLHKASKMGRLSIYTHELAQLRRQVAGKTIHKADAIEVWPFDASFIDALADRVARRSKLEIARNDGTLYVTLDGQMTETSLVATTLT